MLLSPLKVNDCSPELLLVELVLLLDEDELELRNRVQGTATSWSPLVLVEVLLGVVLGLELVEPGVVELLLPELSESTANSIRPEVGLMMMSSIFPSDWPWELVTEAFMSWVPRTWLWEERPVGDRLPEVLEDDDPRLLSEVPPWLVEELPDPRPGVV